MRVTINLVQNLAPEEWGKFDRAKMLELTSKTAKLVAGRKSSFERKNKFSFALQQYEEEGGLFSPPKPGSSLNKLRLEFAKMQKFFQAQTSSIEGIRAVEREQDIRIFGINARGNPKRRMTRAQRTRYWAAYNEFINQNKNLMYASSRIQQVFAQMSFWKNREFTEADLMAALDKFYVEDGNDVSNSGNVYTGRRNR